MSIGPGSPASVKQKELLKLSSGEPHLPCTLHSAHKEKKRMLQRRLHSAKARSSPINRFNPPDRPQARPQSALIPKPTLSHSAHGPRCVHCSRGDTAAAESAMHRRKKTSPSPTDPAEALLCEDPQVLIPSLIYLLN